MAKNWTAAEAAKVVAEGTNKAAIQDIGRRFPLFLAAAARGAEGLLEIIQALPDHQTARKIEAAFKETVEDFEEEDEAEEKPAKKEKPAKEDKKKGKGKNKKSADEDEEEEEKPKKGKKGKGKGKKDPEPEEDDFEDDEDEEDEEDGDGYDDMSLAELKKAAKKNKINPKGMSKEEIIAALRGEEPEDDEDEDDEDDDWDL